MTRRWELSNTRYLLGAAGFLNVLNEQVDPLQHRFRIVVSFNIVPRPGISNPTRFEELTAVMDPQGQYAIFEFTGALPRAKLYTHWQSSTNDQTTLDLLSSESFDPWQTVIVDHAPPASNTSSNQSPGTVEFEEYPEPLLRCNYIMRGIQVPEGDHRIEFRFAPPINVLYVSIAAIVLGLGLAGVLIVSKTEEDRKPPPENVPKRS
jgi:hypothetical protein